MKGNEMNNITKLRVMLRDMENSLGIFGDVIGAICIFGILIVGLFFAGVYQ
jgi:hypothetical protein